MFKLKLEGNKALLKKLDKISENIRQVVEEEIEIGARNIAEDAEQRVPVDNGILRSSIKAEAKGLESQVEVRAKYAAYVEFGTGTKVKVPAGVEAYAREFQGKSSGSWEHFEKDIIEWMKKKGIDLKHKWAIMQSIIKYGVTPQPFLFPAFFAEVPKLTTRLNKEIKKEIK